MKQNWLGISDRFPLTEKIDSVLQYTDISVQWQRAKEDLHKKLQKQEASVAVVAIDDDSVYELCQKLTVAYPDVSFMIVTSESYFDIRRAMRAGASDIILAAASEEDFLETFKAAGQREYQKNQAKLVSPNRFKEPGQIMTIASTKGGIGKTTLAVNLAAAYTKDMKRVAIVDANLQFGDVALFLDCKPRKTIYDWVKEEYHKTVRKVDQHMYHYDDYLHIIAAPQRPEFAEVITGDHIRALLQTLKQEYDIIIVDTQSYLEENGLVALEQANHILLMTYLDLPTLKNGKMLINTLDSLGLKHKVNMVLSRAVKRNKGVTDEAAEEVLGMPLLGRIADMKNIVLASVNEGKPFVYTHPRTKIAKDTFNLIKSVLQQREERPKEQTPKNTRKLLKVGGGK
ncbi:pilus assembly protein CpaE [Salirhabdus euzebyi]|uniref:Pilus assembly protein CpaE n=1 Tax=Salirhabdus euzebyi TaxID=394506 RepID=A0A841Q4K1_9BACI|nr:AAA family ATPase [Salirhabdus euzebyi]MBB6453324.1 pilus assembly protein CpaE [Salirhabdus euzebyi]